MGEEKLAPVPIPNKLAIFNGLETARSHLPVMEKAIALIAPMLELYEPKTNKEDKGLLTLVDLLLAKNLVTEDDIRQAFDNDSQSQALLRVLSKERVGPLLPKIGKIGVCAMDAKVLLKPCRRILNRLIENGEFETIVFGDKVILDEAIENWPTCDFLISFFLTGFPLDKAIAYANYRKPYLLNDLVLQKALWDRRLVLLILNHANVPLPDRLEISRDGGPQINEELKQRLRDVVGMLEQAIHDLTNQHEPEWEMIDDDTLRVGDKILKKPFVEKPVDGENHNIYIYYPKANGGGGRRLFRKIGNKLSEFDPNLNHPRTEGLYIYEQFMDTDNFEDVKAYTVGQGYCHAETRKLPVVDGIVRRNTHGKEIRYITELTEEETEMARNVLRIFQQTICGFDLLRVNGALYVIDVNGFSFVKDNNDYYDTCALILRQKFMEAKKLRDLIKNKLPALKRLDLRFEEKEQKWVLKGMVLVIRHADRTPKQKFKYSFRLPLFISLLKGHREEVIIRNVSDLEVVLRTAKIALEKKFEDPKKLTQLCGALEKKMHFPGTKVQLKPTVNSETEEVEKVQLILKWGGEPTHSAKYQAHDVGEQMRQNIKLLNRLALDNVKVYTSLERRVTALANLATMSLLGLDAEHDTLPDDYLIVRKDLLDDSNAAKDLMDKVKKKLKPLLRQGAEAPPQFTWPPKMPQPFDVIKRVCQLMNLHKQILEYNFETKDVNTFQDRWCCGEDPMLFRERWDKLFQEFVLVEKTHPLKISELYDTMKYDALHNRKFLQKVFAWDKNDPELQKRLQATCPDIANHSLVKQYPINELAANNFKIPDAFSPVNSTPPGLATSSQSHLPLLNVHAGSLGWVLQESLNSTKLETPFDQQQFSRLRELYKLSKVLFDFICPQEYGIKEEEKLDIGLLTSLPLAKQVLLDISEFKRKDTKPGVVLYFTKESHIYTLLNVLFELKVPMKIARNALPELDYLSQIVFELYEAEDPNSPSGKKHLIRLLILPGCHTQDPLDVQLDDDHYIGCIPKLSLTRHLDMDLVTQRLKLRFSRVLLPKKFTPVNILGVEAKEKSKEKSEEPANLPKKALDKSKESTENKDDIPVVTPDSVQDADLPVVTPDSVQEA
ncbi:histidine-type phosphatase [Kocuria palustris]|nr:histidine-type phosphatase [Kocuria palustris]